MPEGSDLLEGERHSASNEWITNPVELDGVHQMHSREGGVINFVVKLQVGGKDAERWTTEVGNAMSEANRWVMQKTMEPYFEMDCSDWVLEHPGQIVLKGSQLRGIAEVVTALEESDGQKYY